MTAPGDARWSVEHGMVVRRIGAGPEVVWIHGLGEQAASFDAIARHPQLAGFTHVLPDLPGYGRSAPVVTEVVVGQGAAGIDTIDASAAALTAWLDGRVVVLAGHSMGGVLATLVAEQTAVAGVLVIDGNLSRGDCTFSATALEHTREDFTARGFATMRDQVYARGVGEPALRGYHAALTLACPRTFHDHARDLVAVSARATLAARLAAVGARAPVRFVAGVPGGICARSQVLLDHHGIPWSPIDPAGHWPFVDQPDAFAAVARALFDAAIAG